MEKGMKTDVSKDKGVKAMKTSSSISKTFWDDNEWARRHYQELVKEYPDRCWVAIAGEKVVSAGEDLGEVEKIAWEKTKRKDCPLIFIERSAHVYSN